MAVALTDEDATEAVVIPPAGLPFMSWTSLLTKSQRLILGLLVLLLVDVIWVLSSELTKVSNIWP